MTRRLARLYGRVTVTASLEGLRINDGLTGKRPHGLGTAIIMPGLLMVARLLKRFYVVHQPMLLGLIGLDLHVGSFVYEVWRSVFGGLIVALLICGRYGVPYPKCWGKSGFAGNW